MKFEQLLKKFDYQLPPELIAQEPSSPRDAARLLVYNRKTKTITIDTFKNLANHLPSKAVLVLNQTRVVPARLQVKKETGGKAEILYISHDKNYIKAIADRKLQSGSFVSLCNGRYKVIQMKIAKQEGQFYYLKPSFPISSIYRILQKYGQTPLPPYIKHSKLSEKQRREKYQTVFAKQGMSVAAPTASLHFTKNLMDKLKKRGITIKYVNLDVNLGTFAPLREEHIQTGTLHTENYFIDKATAQFLNRAKEQGRTIVAVGTTVVRTLESAAVNAKLQKLGGPTNIFIQENSKIKFVDSLITNFHVPKSSLLMLVSSLVGRKKLFEIYQAAIAKRFRFFSFGDGMLIL